MLVLLSYGKLSVVAKTIKMSQLGDEIAKALKSSDVEIKARANKAIRVATIKTWGKIIRMTPVDTGRARSNWFIGLSVGSEINTVNRRRGPQYIDKKLPFDLLTNKVFMYNNLPYIETLEFGGYGDGPKTAGGFSTQAPQGFVRISLLGWGRALKKAFKAG